MSRPCRACGHPYDHEPGCSVPSHELATLRARIAELEAERDRLREALEYIAEEHDAGRHDGKPEPCPAHRDYDMWLKARAALDGEKGEG